MRECMSVVQCIKAYNEVSSIDCCPAGDVFKQDVVSNLLLLAAGKTCFFFFLRHHMS
jgi:hypothetical protein